MSPALLQVRQLECAYGPVVALAGVSLDVPEGDIVAILGANGAGKSTLLKAISGILAPDRGQVLLAGTPIEGQAPDRIVRRGVVQVPEGREIFPLLTVAENLAMGAYLRRDRGVADDLEAMFGYFPVLRRRLDQPGGTLSGGEQQMLAIARGLMARPRLLLLDEPSLGLAPVLVRDLFATIARLCRERGLGILLVEQNARAALAVADSGAVLDSGRIVLSGSAAELGENRDIREFLLGGEAAAGQRGERRWKLRKTWR